MTFPSMLARIDLKINLFCVSNIRSATKKNRSASSKGGTEGFSIGRGIPFYRQCLLTGTMHFLHVLIDSLYRMSTTPLSGQRIMTTDNETNITREKESENDTFRKNTP